MKINLMLVASQLLIASSLFASGTQGGTPPAVSHEIEDILLSGTLTQGRDLSKGLLDKNRIEELLSKIPSRDLIKTPEGRTLIPLSPENIRRLNIRTSTGIEALIRTDAGESFKVKALDDRLIDPKKEAEVVEKEAAE